ncbi:unnamed protein product [Brassica oleracea]|uniref:Uncharacterized protein n=1 Tax=Brassica oleracea var. oleracea TaxID=109376 RepID=A0A0D3DL38_BRAOL
MEMAKEMVVEGEIRREAMFVEVWKRNGLTECGVTYPGGVEQSCLILWSPHTGERNPETLSNTIMENLQRLVSELKAGRYRETIVIKLLHLWEAKNVNKGAVPFTTRGSPRKSSRVRLQDHGRVRQARFPDETGSSYPWPCPPLASLRYSLLQWTRKEDWREEEKVSVRGCIVSQDLSVLKTIVFLFIA